MRLAATGSGRLLLVRASRHLAPRLSLRAIASAAAPPAAASSAPLAKPPKFAELVGTELAAALRGLGVFAPNVVQAEALRASLSSKRDVWVCAQTGSGKTLMFLLPMLHQLSLREPLPPRAPRQRLTRAEVSARDKAAAAAARAEARGRAPPVPWRPDPAAAARREQAADRRLTQPEALVLVPTRELAEQVGRVARELAAALPSPPAVEVITGGAKFAAQKQALKRGDARLVVGTPERLLYHMRSGLLGMRQLRAVAIDEVDAMLCAADGITRETAELLDELPRNRDRQHLLASATMSPEHERAVRSRFPRAQLVRHRGALVPTLRQAFIPLRQGGDPEHELVRLLERAAADPWLRGGATMVFCGGTRRADRVHELLRSASPELRPALLHGETRPTARELALRAFEEDETRTMVCTDVAARGLDFVGVRHVVMYDVPRDVAAYIHRAGRTARRGQPGLVSCLVRPHEAAFYRQMSGEDESRPGTPLQRSAGRIGLRVDAAAAAALAAEEAASLDLVAAADEADGGGAGAAAPSYP